MTRLEEWRLANGHRVLREVHHAYPIPREAGLHELQVVYQSLPQPPTEARRLSSVEYPEVERAVEGCGLLSNGTEGRSSIHVGRLRGLPSRVEADP